MKTIVILSSICILAACNQQTSHNGEKNQNTDSTTSSVLEESQNVGDKLPPNVRVLLIQEMQAVLTASQTILEGIVKGEHDLVAEKAEDIHNSFILKQQMTSEDREAFKAAVPEAFVQRDRAFHKLTADLAVAAQAGDQVQEEALFVQMVESCIKCHSMYAGKRFSGLKNTEQSFP